MEKQFMEITVQKLFVHAFPKAIKSLQIQYKQGKARNPLHK